MKRLFKLLVLLTVCVALALCVCSCDGNKVENNPPPHSHADVDDDLVCDGCGEAYDDGIDHIEHTVENGVCTTCGLKESTPGFEYRLHPDGDYYILTGYGSCTESDIFIGIHDNLSVRWIDTDAFRGKENITSVEIGDCVQHIGVRAFSGCKGLTEIVIPEGVKSVRGAFPDCINLEKVEILGPITNIDSGSFIRCYNLKSITIPETVTSISDDAFRECYRLAEVINKSALNITPGSEENGRVALYARAVHNGNTRIVKEGDYYFYAEAGNNALLSYTGTEVDLTLPADFRGEPYDIHSGAFGEDSGVERVVVPEGVRTIGKHAFSYNENVTEIVLPKTLKRIEERAFCCARNLESISIPDGCEYIGNSAFSSSGIRAIYVPESVIEIGSHAFDTYLNMIYIPGTVKTVGNNAVSKNEGRNTVYIGASEIPDGWDVEWCGETEKINMDVYNVYRSESGFIYCVFVNENAAIIGLEKVAKNLVIPAELDGKKVKNIEERAFNGYMRLETVRMENGVNTIKQFAFEKCRNLKKLIIGEGVTYIGYMAFAECTALEIAYVPDSVIETNSYVFYKSENLTIYCEAFEKPAKWPSVPSWNPSDSPVNWGYGGDPENL